MSYGSAGFVIPASVKEYTDVCIKQLGLNNKILGVGVNFVATSASTILQDFRIINTPTLPIVGTTYKLNGAVLRGNSAAGNNMRRFFGNKDLFLLFTCNSNTFLWNCANVRSSGVADGAGNNLSTIKSLEMSSSSTPYFTFDRKTDSTGFGIRFNLFPLPNTFCVCYRPFKDRRVQDFSSPPPGTSNDFLVRNPAIINT